MLTISAEWFGYWGAVTEEHGCGDYSICERSPCSRHAWAAEAPTVPLLTVLALRTGAHPPHEYWAGARRYEKMSANNRY